MQPLIHAFYQDQPAGIFDMDEADRRGRYEWLPAFQNDHTRLTERSMADLSGRHLAFDANNDLPIPFRNYLPDAYSKSLLQEALRNTDRTVESLSTLAWLSLTGNRGMGVFRFEPAGYPELNEVEPVDLDRMVRYAALIQQGKGSELSDRRLRELLRCGLFVKGDSPKILVAINDFTGEVISGQGRIPEGYEAWIVKLDGVVAGSAEKLTEEYAGCQKALACGIQVAPTRMLRDGHWKHLMVKRFDRVAGEKLAFVTCPSSVTSWEDVFRFLREYRLPYSDMDEMFRRLVLSIQSGNGMLDARKVCLTYDRKMHWRLSPSFNWKSTTGGLMLLGKTQDWTRSDLLLFGKQMNIRKAPKILDAIPL